MQNNYTSDYNYITACGGAVTCGGGGCGGAGCGGGGCGGGGCGGGCGGGGCGGGCGGWILIDLWNEFNKSKMKMSLWYIKINIIFCIKSK